MSKDFIEHGTVMLVYFHDGKQKFRTFDTSEAMAAEVSRLKKIVPSRNMYLGVIDWDECTLDNFIGEEPDSIPERLS